MDDLYNDKEINDSLAAKAIAFEDLLAGLSLSDNQKATTATEGDYLPPDSKSIAAEIDIQEAEGETEGKITIKPPQLSGISPASQIYQTLCASVDASYHWLGTKDQIVEFIKKAENVSEHPLRQMCKNLQSIVTLLVAKGDEVLDPSQTTFGFVEASISRLLQYLGDMEKWDESGWMSVNAVKPAKKIQECLTKLKEEYMMVDGRKNGESIAEEDRVVIESSSSEEDSDGEVEQRPRKILIPKSRRDKLPPA